MIISGTMDIVSVSEAASKLGITRQAVLKKINASQLKAIKIGKIYIVIMEVDND